MLWPISVQRENAAQPIGFDPQVRQMQAGDSAFWHNLDHDTGHQPYPIGGKIDTWFAEPIPAQATSDQVRFGAAATVDYSCALHPDETGTIDVAAIISIGPTFEGGVAFSPSPLALAVKRSAVWNNSDSVAHRPMPKDGPADAWLQQDIAPGDTSPFVPFNTPGLIEYVCAIHPSETGSITVA
jgi:plastocyanin